MIGIFWFLLLFFINSFPDARGQDYPPLKDMSFQSYSSQLELEKYKIAIEIYWKDLDPQLVDRNIKDASAAILVYAHAHVLSIQKPCKIVLEDVDIYETDVKTLNDHARISGWKSQDQIDSIWGLYDSYPATAAKAIVILTDHDDRIDRILVAHEMAHYWYDQFCWGSGWDGTSETFAMSFQNFYIENFVDQGN